MAVPLPLVDYVFTSGYNAQQLKEIGVWGVNSKNPLPAKILARFPEEGTKFPVIPFPEHIVEFVFPHGANQVVSGFHTFVLSQDTENVKISAKLDLAKVLASPAKKSKFREFLRHEMAEENLLFWDDIERLRFMDEEDVTVAVQRIFRLYISDGAPLMVNIPSSLREKLLRAFNLDKFSIDMFNDAQIEVSELLRRDNFPRFINKQALADIYAPSTKVYGCAILFPPDKVDVVVETVTPTFDLLLKTPDILAQFRTHLKSENQLGNLLFYLEVERLPENPSMEHLKQLYDDFVSREAVHDVSVPLGLRKQFLDMKEEDYHPQMFDATQKAVRIFLEDAFKKFMKSRSPSTRSCMAIGLLSRWPFWESFELFLRHVSSLVQNGKAPAPLERILACIVCEVPVPPPGRTKVKLACAGLSVDIVRPPLNTFPLATSPRKLLEKLDVGNVLTVLGAVLLEKSVLFVGEDSSSLALAVDGFTSLLFPLHWQYPYIPLLPSGFSALIHCGLPYIFGTLKKFLPVHKNLDKVVVVQLEMNRIQNAPNLMGLDTSKAWQRALKRLQTLVPSPTQLPNLDVHSVRSAFLLFFIKLFRDYDRHVRWWPSERGATLFDSKGFLAAKASEDSQWADFLAAVVPTRMFTAFLEDRVVPSKRLFEVVFFDECVQAAHAVPTYQPAVFLQNTSQSYVELMEVRCVECGTVSLSTSTLVRPDWSEVSNGCFALPLPCTLKHRPSDARQESLILQVMESIMINFSSKKSSVSVKSQTGIERLGVGLEQLQDWVNVFDREAVLFANGSKLYTKASRDLSALLNADRDNGQDSSMYIVADALQQECDAWVEAFATFSSEIEKLELPLRDLIMEMNDAAHAVTDELASKEATVGTEMANMEKAKLAVIHLTQDTPVYSADKAEESLHIRKMEQMQFEFIHTVATASFSLTKYMEAAAAAQTRLGTLLRKRCTLLRDAMHQYVSSRCAVFRVHVLRALNLLKNCVFPRHLDREGRDLEFTMAAIKAQRDLCKNVLTWTRGRSTTLAALVKDLQVNTPSLALAQTELFVQAHTQTAELFGAVNSKQEETLATPLESLERTYAQTLEKCKLVKKELSAHSKDLVVQCAEEVEAIASKAMNSAFIDTVVGVQEVVKGNADHLRSLADMDVLERERHFTAWGNQLEAFTMRGIRLLFQPESEGLDLPEHMLIRSEQPSSSSGLFVQKMWNGFPVILATEESQLLALKSKINLIETRIAAEDAVALPPPSAFAAPPSPMVSAEHELYDEIERRIASIRNVCIAEKELSTNFVTTMRSVVVEGRRRLAELETTLSFMASTQKNLDALLDKAREARDKAARASEKASAALRALEQQQPSERSQPAKVSKWEAKYAAARREALTAGNQVSEAEKALEACIHSNADCAAQLLEKSELQLRERIKFNKYLLVSMVNSQLDYIKAHVRAISPITAMKNIPETKLLSFETNATKSDFFASPELEAATVVISRIVSVCKWLATALTDRCGMQDVRLKQLKKFAKQLSAQIQVRTSSMDRAWAAATDSLQQQSADAHIYHGQLLSTAQLLSDLEESGQIVLRKVAESKQNSSKTRDRSSDLAKAQAKLDKAQGLLDAQMQRVNEHRAALKDSSKLESKMRGLTKDADEARLVVEDILARQKAVQDSLNDNIEMIREKINTFGTETISTLNDVFTRLISAEKFWEDQFMQDVRHMHTVTSQISPDDDVVQFAELHSTGFANPWAAEEENEPQSQWMTLHTGDGKPYYFNTITKETLYRKPNAVNFEAQVTALDALQVPPPLTVRKVSEIVVQSPPQPILQDEAPTIHPQASKTASGSFRFSTSMPRRQSTMLRSLPMSPSPTAPQRRSSQVFGADYRTAKAQSTAYTNGKSTALVPPSSQAPAPPKKLPAMPAPPPPVLSRAASDASDPHTAPQRPPQVAPRPVSAAASLASALPSPTGNAVPGKLVPPSKPAPPPPGPPPPTARVGTSSSSTAPSTTPSAPPPATTTPPVTSPVADTAPLPPAAVAPPPSTAPLPPAAVAPLPSTAPLPPSSAVGTAPTAPPPATVPLPPSSALGTAPTARPVSVPLPPRVAPPPPSLPGALPLTAPPPPQFFVRAPSLKSLYSKSLTPQSASALAALAAVPEQTSTLAAQVNPALDLMVPPRRESEAHSAPAQQPIVDSAQQPTTATESQQPTTATESQQPTTATESQQPTTATESQPTTATELQQPTVRPAAAELAARQPAPEEEPDIFEPQSEAASPLVEVTQDPMPATEPGPSAAVEEPVGASACAVEPGVMDTVSLDDESDSIMPVVVAMPVSEFEPADNPIAEPEDRVIDEFVVLPIIVAAPAQEPEPVTETVDDSVVVSVHETPSESAETSAAGHAQEPSAGPAQQPVQEAVLPTPLAEPTQDPIDVTKPHSQLVMEEAPVFTSPAPVDGLNVKQIDVTDSNPSFVPLSQSELELPTSFPPITAPETSQGPSSVPVPVPPSTEVAPKRVGPPPLSKTTKSPPPTTVKGPPRPPPARAPPPLSSRPPPLRGKAAAPPTASPPLRTAPDPNAATVSAHASVARDSALCALDLQAAATRAPPQLGPAPLPPGLVATVAVPEECTTLADQPPMAESVSAPPEETLQALEIVSHSVESAPSSASVVPPGTSEHHSVPQGPPRPPSTADESPQSRDATAEPVFRQVPKVASSEEPPPSHGTTQESPEEVIHVQAHDTVDEPSPSLSTTHECLEAPHVQTHAAEESTPSPKSLEAPHVVPVSSVPESLEAPHVQTHDAEEPAPCPHAAIATASDELSQSLDTVEEAPQYPNAAEASSQPLRTSAQQSQPPAVATATSEDEAGQSLPQQPPVSAQNCIVSVVSPPAGAQSDATASDQPVEQSHSHENVEAPAVSTPPTAPNPPHHPTPESAGNLAATAVAPSEEDGSKSPMSTSVSAAAAGPLPSVGASDSSGPVPVLAKRTSKNFLPEELLAPKPPPPAWLVALGKTKKKGSFQTVTLRTNETLAAELLNNHVLKSLSIYKTLVNKGEQAVPSIAENEPKADEGCEDGGTAPLDAEVGRVGRSLSRPRAPTCDLPSLPETTRLVEPEPPVDVVQAPIVVPASIKLRVVDETSNDVYGFVVIQTTTVLKDVREMIDDELDDVPDAYIFVWDGAPVGKKQEGKLLACEFVPQIYIRAKS